MASNVRATDRFVEGKLRKARKDKVGTQRRLAESANVSTGTVSRAENGKNVNDTSIILILARLGYIPYGTYSLNDPKIRRAVARYARATNRGRHAKGWDGYCTGISEDIHEAA